ncbi:MAG: hypothetical protein RIF33_03745 [Cyclobacteriaceae bacterium]
MLQLGACTPGEKQPNSKTSKYAGVISPALEELGLNHGAGDSRIVLMEDQKDLVEFLVYL